MIHFQTFFCSNVNPLTRSGLGKSIYNFKNSLFLNLDFVSLNQSIIDFLCIILASQALIDLLCHLVLFFH